MMHGIGRSGLPWNSGVFNNHGNAASVAGFESWRGRPIDTVLWFAPRDRRTRPACWLNATGAASGANVNQLSANGSSAQVASQPLANGTYTLAPANATGLRLQTTGTADASNVNIRTTSSATTQQWILTSTSGSTYTLFPNA